MTSSPTKEQLKQAIELYPSLWATQLKTSAGLPFEFKKRKFMVDIMNDFSPKQVFLKPPQIGASETQFTKACYVAKKKHKDIIYTLPSQTDVQDMVGGKFNRIIAQNPSILGEWVKDHDTIEQKQIGQNIIYFRGTIGKTQAMMVSSGLNIHDELDASDMTTIVQYETRQEAQEKEEDKWRWVFSHPSLKGNGVDTYWERSDKKEWVVTCPTCTQKQVLTWPKSLSREKNAFVCKACDGILLDSTRINGEWYNKDLVKWEGTVVGDYEFSGWHASQLMLYNKTAKDIFDAYDDPLKTKQYFHNFTLGLPYEGGDDQITTEQVLANCVEETNSQEGRIIIGVDPGLPVHYVLMNKEGIFHYGTCRTPDKGDPYDDIRFLLKQYPKSTVISDQGGDLNPMRVLQQEFPGRVFLAFYRKNRKSNDLISWGEGTEYGIVTIDRNNYIQLVVGYLKEKGRVLLNGSPDSWKEYADHWANMYREKIVVREQKDKDDRTLYGAEYVWKRRGPDHYAHATVYALAGMSKYGQSLSTVTGGNVLDLLPKGQIIGDEGVVLRLGDGSIAF